ncbi:PREDICTED: uncharacterized protein LOC105625170 [Atta cephalotes]|uniref:Uncharacterized protein n=1 Tax=Atta cephalotes TaxID=12957 RepID=A0A158NWJ3_ATTCE|nr:PREDICTED: uncharacterized protein LOC105625170 [Atta cephalotes]
MNIESFELGNNSDINAFKLYVCIVKYHPHDLHRCYNLQRHFIVQRRAPRHPLEAWYFWLDNALLVSVIFVVSIPRIKKHLLLCTLKPDKRGISSGYNARINDNRQNAQEFNQPRTNENQISISIVPTTFSSQRKMLVIGAQPSFTHMTPVVA